MAIDKKLSKPEDEVYEYNEEKIVIKKLSEDDLTWWNKHVIDLFPWEEIVDFLNVLILFSLKNCQKTMLSTYKPSKMIYSMITTTNH